MHETTSQPTAQVGVIIARFQVPEFHRAHRELIAEVQRRHKKVLILLGVTTVRMSHRQPLDFWTRERMIKSLKQYESVLVQPIKDQPTDTGWSRNVDAKIAEVAGKGGALLYGSRDSFIPHYQGRYPTHELPASRDLSGSEMRKEASEEVRSEKAYRVGMIYAASQRYPTAYQTVDAIVWRRARLDGDGTGPATGPIEILLGRKDADAPGKWRFPGGFVDPKKDTTKEGAASREVREEMGDLTLGEAQYLLSGLVDDWRYRKEDDKILTSVFTIEYLWGAPKALDDLDAVQWFKAEEVGYNIVAEHAPLWDRALKPLRERLVLA